MNATLVFVSLFLKKWIMILIFLCIHIVSGANKEVFWAVLPPQEGDAKYSFVTGQRGAPKILYQGFSYICAKICNERKYWVCAKQRSRNCKARLITGQNGRLEVSKNVCHNHVPENHEVLEIK